MIEEAIVHVGMHKTGSSSIQHTFNRLKIDDIEYLKLGAPNHSAVLVTILSENPEKYHAHVANARTRREVLELQEAYRARLTELLSQSAASRVILSAEDLSTRRASDLKRLRNILGKYCRSVRVIGYVRSPVSYMQSAFQQRLKGSTQVDLNIERLMPNYRARFEKMDDIFGADHVELIPFDSETLYMHDVVCDFGRRVGANVDKSHVVRANKSLSLEAAAVLYTMRAFAPESDGWSIKGGRPKMVGALLSVGQERLSFSRSLVEPVLHMYRDDIEWMEQRLGSGIVDIPAASAGGIKAEEDLFAIAVAHRDAVRALAEQTLQKPDANMQRLVHLLDWLAETSMATRGCSAGRRHGADLYVKLADASLAPDELLQAAATLLEGPEPEVAEALRRTAGRALRQRQA